MVLVLSESIEELYRTLILLDDSLEKLIHFFLLSILKAENQLFIEKLIYSIFNFLYMLQVISLKEISKEVTL